VAIDHSDLQTFGAEPFSVTNERQGSRRRTLDGQTLSKKLSGGSIVSSESLKVRNSGSNGALHLSAVAAPFSSRADVGY
jgi:hypothetical protein